jgi:Na+/H+ antiporter NhaD/arsenite permease-like protein
MTRFTKLRILTTFAPVFATPMLFVARPAFATAAESAAPRLAPHLDGASLGLAWGIPFLGILLSIAIFPLLAPRFWHAHFGKVTAFWTAAFLVPFVALYGVRIAAFEVLHTLLLEYFPFIILLLALFTAAGGVRLVGDLKGTPLVNTGMLALGAVLASWMGTTGAAMLLIGPVIQANLWRRYNVHVIVFFIFLVANVGGALTPLGDPPLFLGFLKGIDFFWPTRHLFLPMLLVAGLLLLLFFIIDSVFYRREEASARAWTPDSGLHIEGWTNVLLIVGVIGAVLMSGLWSPGITIEIYHIPIELQNLLRDALLLGITYLSWRMTAAGTREANAFTWFPIIEVAKLFLGIFLTIVPVIAILKVGEAGALSSILGPLSENGEPVNAAYFWITGVLSSFLDNAPTYLVFFNSAGGDAEALMGPLSTTLLAISAGAVFFGANTYIGNAPNFMVRAIAEDRGIRMPGFFGYMLWSAGILFPLFLLVTILFFL